MHVRRADAGSARSSRMPPQAPPPAYEATAETSPLIAELLERSKANKEQYDKERLDSYYRRNYEDYFALRKRGVRDDFGFDEQDEMIEARTPARPHARPHARTHAQMHADTRTCTRARARTHRSCFKRGKSRRARARSRTAAGSDCHLALVVTQAS